MSEQKTHAEIIAECYHNTAATQYVRELLDQLDAAHKRDLDAKDSVIQTLSSELQQLQEKRERGDAAEKRLTAQGHFVINPAELSEMFGTAKEVANSFQFLYDDRKAFQGSPEACGFRAEMMKLAQCVMDADLAAVRSCDAIYLLHGWENSRGAKKELAEALKHGPTVMQEGGEG